ncbi:MAG: exodeoxyribonuclease V subunit beta [Gammaproteobacteria bacterium]
MSPADPLTLPLEGVSLIEASAGTGKTTALVNVYLRALLTTHLTVEQILVVTFTRAASGELITRIRKTLVEAQGKLMLGEPDKFLDALAVQTQGGKSRMIERVAAALAALDESAVFTIHGFCQRMLAELAFEVGGAFVTEQRSEEQSLREEIAADFWRTRQAASSPAYARWMLGTFKSPDGILDSVHRALAVSGTLQVEPQVSADEVRHAEEVFLAAADAASKAWQKAGDPLREWLTQSDDLNRTKYNVKTTTRLLGEWDVWLSQSPYPVLPDNFERLTLAKLEASLKKGTVPDETFFKKRLGDALQRAVENLCTLWWQETYVEALNYLRIEARARKRQAREIGFDDMLQNLCDALAGPSGKVLAERIAKRYPLALVDEFQDTDPLQYEIFSGIYADRKNTGLVLIGDPKQAIYRFRGADVFAYMRARHWCEKSERIYDLARNYRTTEPLVAALNTLFGLNEKPFFYDEIPFKAVESGGEISALTIKKEADAPLTVIWQPAPQEAKGGIAGKNASVHDMAGICAGEIERLLALGEAKKAHYRHKRGEQIFVRARDIAVLVSTHRQGDAVQRALRAHRIASVTLSTDSVFTTAEAIDLQIVLAAVAEPARGSRLRRALATPLLGATASEIAELGEDESRWSEIVAAFRGYNTLWQRQGFAAMFAHLLRERRVIERTLARDDGERAMTNLRHLAELAEAQAAHHPGIESLMAWLARECAETHRGDESRELRLESDDELVRIVTIHKAKGLEYPIVFLPFLWAVRRPDGNVVNPAVLTHDADFKPVLDLGSDALPQRQMAAGEEAHAEQARLTYVALTRATHACYLICTPARYAEESALARLLGIETPDTWETALRDWCNAAPEGAMCVRAPAHAKHFLNAESSRAHGEAREFAHADRLQQRFHIASYSLLAAGAHGAMVERPDWDETVQPAPVVEAATGIHAFPAGAASGTFLHAVLEALDFNSNADAIETTTRQLCAAYGFDDRWVETLSPWLVGALATPLAAAGCTLGNIARAQRIDELEFYFPLAQLNADALDQALSAFAPKVPRPALAFGNLAGQMKGYMDLVFESGGRYWIADYKSNRLGSDLDAYTTAALDHAMAEHRYDLQYLIYTVALHRYLATRIPGYDYEKHFGGVLYLFLRGMAPDAPAPRGVWHTRPAWNDVQRLDALLSGDGRA